MTQSLSSKNFEQKYIFILWELLRKQPYPKPQIILEMSYWMALVYLCVLVKVELLQIHFPVSEGKKKKKNTKPQCTHKTLLCWFVFKVTFRSNAVTVGVTYPLVWHQVLLCPEPSRSHGTKDWSQGRVALWKHLQLLCVRSGIQVSRQQQLSTAGYGLCPVATLLTHKLGMPITK